MASASAFLSLRLPTPSPPPTASPLFLPNPLLRPARGGTPSSALVARAVGAAGSPSPLFNPRANPFLSTLASASPEELSAAADGGRRGEDHLLFLEIFQNAKLMASPTQVERSSSSYSQHRPRRPPPDLPSLLLHGRIVYIGMPAFLTFCEGCEVDILLFFEKAGEPVLLVPKFAMDDGSNSDFDATLVLATMLVSQLIDGNVAQQPATSARHAEEPRAATTPSVVPENVSNHTKIWPELSGSAPKSFEANREEHAQERNASASLLNDTSMLPNVKNVPCKPPAADNANDTVQPMQMDHLERAYWLIITA